jgi:Ca2+-binding EF-hand superfamily protein
MSTIRAMRALGAAALLAAAPSMPTGAAPAQQLAQQLAQGETAADPQDIAPDFRQLRHDTARARTPDAQFEVLDVNQDGCIDDGEWRRRSMAVFFILDTEGTDPITRASGGDGQLTRAEAPDLREDLFRAADVNRDGMISAFEFNQAPFTHYEAVPRQTPRCITQPEFTAYVRSLRAGAF